MLYKVTLPSGLITESADRVFIESLCTANGIEVSTIVVVDDSVAAQQAKAAAKLQIDTWANELYTLYVPSPGLLKEYQQAEDDAKAYLANPTTVPQSVASWANPKNWTNEQAANDILAAAARLRYVMGKIREIRLSYKERIDATLVPTEIPLLLATGLATLNKLRG